MYNKRAEMPLYPYTTMKSIDFDHIPQANPFRTPEGYFASFTGRMMQRIQSQPRPQLVPPNPFLRWMPLWGAACVAALMLLFTQVLDVNVPQASNGRPSISAQADGGASASAQNSDVDCAYDCLTSNLPYEYYAYDSYAQE